MEDRIERIKQVENALNRAQAAVDRFAQGWEDYRAVGDDLRLLEDYLNSAERREDLSADEAGLLPADLPRGALSEDAIWNLLEKNGELTAEMQHTLCEQRPEPEHRAAPTDYDMLVAQAQAIVEDVPHLIANLANLAALIYGSLDDVNWAGFYLVKGDRLILGPFRGNVACVEIPFGKGVCGTAAEENRTQLVPDVHCFSGHIACDAASRSEIVVPLHRDGVVCGVLDIDSPTLNRFSEKDREGLERLAAVIEEALDRSC